MLVARYLWWYMTVSSREPRPRLGGAGSSFSFPNPIIMEIVSSRGSIFRPSSAALPEETKSEIQIHRVMTVLGLILVPLFGVFYAWSSPQSIDPLWARLGLAGLFGALLGTSYRSEWVREHYVVLLRGIIYLLLTWFAIVTGLNQFTANYALGLLLVYAVLIVVIGVGVDSLSPVFAFSSYGILITVGALVASSGAESSPIILLACMVTVVLIGTVAIGAHLSARRTIQEREDRLRGLANSIPGVIFQLRPNTDGLYRMHFVGERARSVLDLSPHPVGFFDRFFARIPVEYQEGLREELEQAVAEEGSWHVEVPYDQEEGSRSWLLITATPVSEEGTVVFNGVILDITEREHARRALRDRQKKMESLYTATSLLLTTHSREVVADRTTTLLNDVFEFSTGTVGLRQNGNALSRGAEDGKYAGSDEWVGAIENETLADRACESGETIVVNDVDSVNSIQGHDGIETLAAVPIGGHGAIVVGQTEADQFDPFDLRLLEVLASYVTVVLDRLDGR